MSEPLENMKCIKIGDTQKLGAGNETKKLLFAFSKKLGWLSDGK